MGSKLTKNCLEADLCICPIGITPCFSFCHTALEGEGGRTVAFNSFDRNITNY